MEGGEVEGEEVEGGEVEGGEVEGGEVKRGEGRMKKRKGAYFSEEGGDYSFELNQKAKLHIRVQCQFSLPESGPGPAVLESGWER